jgi:hypothetical protein
MASLSSQPLRSRAVRRSLSRGVHAPSVPIISASAKSHCATQRWKRSLPGVAATFWEMHEQLGLISLRGSAVNLRRRHCGRRRSPFSDCRAPPIARLCRLAPPLLPKRKSNRLLFGPCNMTSMIMIRCSITDVDVATSTQANLISFDRLNRVSELACPACGSAHVWSRTNAWLSVTTTRKKRQGNVIRPHLAARPDTGRPLSWMKLTPALVRQIQRRGSWAPGGAGPHQR